MKRPWAVAALIAVVLGAVVVLVVRMPQRGTEDDSAFADLYNQLPYQELFPLGEGPIEIDGRPRRIRIGFS